MSKCAELCEELAELKQYGKRITEIAEELQRIFSSREDGKETHEESKAESSIEDIRDRMKQFASNGFSSEMREILMRHGADNLTNLSPDEYGGVMRDLEVFANAT